MTIDERSRISWNIGPSMISWIQNDTNTQWIQYSLREEDRGYIDSD